MAWQKVAMGLVASVKWLYTDKTCILNSLVFILKPFSIHKTYIIIKPGLHFIRKRNLSH